MRAALDLPKLCIPGEKPAFGNVRDGRLLANFRRFPPISLSSITGNYFDSAGISARKNRGCPALNPAQLNTAHAQILYFEIVVSAVSRAFPPAAAFLHTTERRDFG